VKKSLFVIITAITFLIFFITGTVECQSLEFGIEGSPSLISVWGYRNLDWRATIGFSTGIMLKYTFKNDISIGTDVAFNRKGAKTIPIYNINAQEFTNHENFNYLTVPILIRKTFGVRMKYFFETGPYGGYLLSEYQTNNNLLYGYGPVNVNFTSSFKRFDLGIIAGSGISIPIKEGLELSFEIRENLGLYNISPYPIYYNGTIKTNALNLLVGLSYKFSKNNPN
jgi:hypothetical protein